MGLGLSADEVAALSSQEREDVHTFIATLRGSHRYILDYLAEEVLLRQPRHVQTFLLRSSVLDRLCGPLCDALRVDDGTPMDSQEILEALDRANLFIVPLDEERRWYRYHHLFADVLRHQLEQTEPDRIPQLHHRACMWYEKNGFASEAVHHALAAGEHDRAASLLEAAAMSLLSLGEVATLQVWLDALPAETVSAHPYLGIAYGWVLALKGQQAAIAERLQQVESQLGVTGHAASPNIKPDELRGQLAALHAQVALFQQDWRAAMEHCRQALALMSEDNRLTRALVTDQLGMAERYQGAPGAEDDLREASRLAHAAGHLLLELFSLQHLAALQEIQGQLHEAEQMLQQALQLGRRRDGQSLAIAGVAHVGLGQLLYEWNDLDGARRELTEGIALCRRGGIGRDMELEGLITLALVDQAQGHAAAADETLRAALHIAQTRNRRDWVVRVAGYQAHLAITRGQGEAAARWAQDYSIGPDDELNSWLDIEHATLARLLIAQRKSQDALRLLERLLLWAEPAARMGRVIEFTALPALAFQVQGDSTAASAALERALSLAQPQGYIRLFADEGKPTAALLRQAAARGVAVEYICRLLQAMEAPSTQPAPPGVQPLIEPLSERELQVLRLIAAGLTNPQIAAELVVVVGTVKAHVNSIYRKLDVRNRVQAVGRAKELNLL